MRWQQPGRGGPLRRWPAIADDSDFDFLDEVLVKLWVLMKLWVLVTLWIDHGNPCGRSAPRGSRERIRRAAGRTGGAGRSRRRWPLLALCLALSFAVGPAMHAAEPPAAAGEAPRFPPNRLAKETSPYLLAHAHNPVRWHPWDAEALELAKREKKLIFLSIGYSSCHWCHVMERESFMDEEIAEFLNKHFVCIKVDREERPDVDEIYMASLQRYYQLIGTPSRGGWPLSMFLTPEGLPVAGGTYFPPREKDGQDGFLNVIGRIQAFWERDAATVEQSARQLTSLVQGDLRRRAGLPLEPVGLTVLDELQQGLAEDFDAVHGGFSYDDGERDRPKFPEPSNLLFLLDRARHAEEAADREAALRMLTLSLDRMAEGGIHDHLGGGFHRYAVERTWTVPHFEKMLYDNAQLASLYAEAFELTQRESYRDTARAILAFVERELTSPEGGFYAALDAETDGVEGAFYAWTADEVRAALGQAADDDFQLFAAAYGLDGPPNFEGRYVLRLPRPLAATAERLALPPEQAARRLDELCKQLLAARDKRTRPRLDNKILASWNGLMIRGFADCGRIFDEPRYVQTAVRAAELTLSKLRTPEGRLLRTYTDGEARLNAYLDDYAFLVDGLIALHRAAGERRWLTAADELTALQIELFEDRAGGFFFTSNDHEALLARSKGAVDGALPGGNSVAVDNLVYLGRTLPRPEYLQRAEQTVQSYSALLHRAPTALPRMLTAFSSLRRK